jgi:DNA replication protein DnaC
MLYTQTVEKLHSLRLEGMVHALEEQRQQKDIVELDFETRLALLVDRECLYRDNRGLALRLKNAQLKISNATLEDLDYRPSRGLKRAQIEQLRASQWLKDHRNCLITGPTGTGKTWVACALGHQACRDGYRTSYYYAPKLFRALETAQVDGSLPCACPAKMNQHLVYQRIDLDLFVKGVTTRGKFVERGDGHYRVLAEAAECIL